MCGMINNISWISYLILISLVLLVYYLVVLLYYYKAELLQLTMPGNRKGMSGDSANISRAVVNSDPDLFPVVHVLMGKLGNIIYLLKNEYKSKEQMLEMPGNILAQKPGLTDTPFQSAKASFEGRSNEAVPCATQ